MTFCPCKVAEKAPEVEVDPTVTPVVAAPVLITKLPTNWPLPVTLTAFDVGLIEELPDGVLLNDGVTVTVPMKPVAGVTVTEYAPFTKAVRDVGTFWVTVNGATALYALLVLYVTAELAPLPVPAKVSVPLPGTASPAPLVAPVSANVTWPDAESVFDPTGVIDPIPVGNGDGGFTVTAPAP